MGMAMKMVLGSGSGDARKQGFGLRKWGRRRTRKGRGGVLSGAGPAGPAGPVQLNRPVRFTRPVWFFFIFLPSSFGRFLSIFGPIL